MDGQTKATYQNQVGAGPSTEKISRIQNDTQTLLGMVQRVRAIETHIVKHAMALGYYQPQPESGGTKPQAVSTSMTDAIGDMNEALDAVSASLTLFE